MKIYLRQNKAITLIALVITIIVLLILAGVAIAALTGENGLLNRASSAQDMSKRAELIEKVKLDILDNEIDKRTEKSHKSLKDILDEYFDSVPDDLTDMNTVLTARTEYGGFNDITVGEIVGSSSENNAKVFWGDQFYFNVGGVEDVIKRDSAQSYSEYGITENDIYLDSTVVEGYNAISLSIPKVDYYFTAIVADVNVVNDINVYPADKFYTLQEVESIIGKQLKNQKTGIYYNEEGTPFEDYGKNVICLSDMKRYTLPSDLYDLHSGLTINSSNSNIMLTAAWGNGADAIENGEKYVTDEERIIEFTVNSIKTLSDNFEAGKTYVVIDVSKLENMGTYTVTDYSN